MTGALWTLKPSIPQPLRTLEPLTTGLLGQEGLKLWSNDRGDFVGVRASGIVYPVFLEPLEVDHEAGARTVLAQVQNSWCLMGPAAWVSRAEPLMPASVISRRVEYEFLARPLQDLEVPVGPGVCRRLEARDANAVYPLQEGYEKEEVLFRPEDFQPLATRLQLGRLLKTQCLVGLWENGKPVAKAGTNALTPAWAQIGGVYTRPEHRGQGHQKRLMAYLLNRLASDGRGACLFVKKNNRPALALYRGLGFEGQGDFLITYGERTR